jgi:hypothetical protein
VQIYRRAQVDTLRHLQQQTEKAIATTVDAKLKSAEEAEGRELEVALASAKALGRAPMSPVKCSVERAACVECYRYCPPWVCHAAVGWGGLGGQCGIIVHAPVERSPLFAPVPCPLFSLRSYGASDELLRCAEAVQKLESCSAANTKSLVWKHEEA